MAEDTLCWEGQRAEMNEERRALCRTRTVRGYDPGERADWAKRTACKRCERATYLVCVKQEGTVTQGRVSESN